MRFPAPLAICAFLAFTQVSSAETTTAFLFANHMVLPSGAPVPVWGTAKPGETVTIEFDGQSKSAEAASDGSWRLFLDPMEPSSEPRSMIVSGRSPIQGVLVGDVWLCIGDQNMMLAPQSSQPENAGENPLIRHYMGRGGVSPVPLSDFSLPSYWAVTDENGLSRGNPVAHGFASAVQAKAGVPIGILNLASHQGATLLSFTPISAHKHLTQGGPVEELRQEMEVLDPTSPKGKTMHREFRQSVVEWRKDAAARIEKGEFPLPMPKPPGAETSVAGCYNALLHPLVEFPVKGVIFYLNSRTNSSAEAYREQLKALALGLRDALRNPELHFLTAGFHDTGAVTSDAARLGSGARFAEASRRLAGSVSKASVATGSDVGGPGSFATLQPQELGCRLGLLANRQVYGDTSTVASGPVLQSQTVVDGKVILSFDTMGSNLQSDGPLGSFAIAGEDKKFHWATANIVGSTVELVAPEVPAPKSVRYDAVNFSEGSRLQNKEGLPTLPFIIELVP